MADEVISNLRTTIKSVVYLTSDENLQSPLQINVHQCKLLARNASETSKVLDNFLKVLCDRELQSKIKDGHQVSDDDIPNWIPVAQEFLRVLKGGEALIKACCCGNGGRWLQVAIQQGDMKETFAKILYDIQWHVSLLCSILITASKDFEPTACEGNLDMTVHFTLLIAAKQDREELEGLLKDLKGDHDCAGNDEHCESECKKHLGGEQCLAAKLLEKMTAKDQLEGIGRKNLSSTSPHFLWVNPHELQKGKQLGIGSFAKVRETTWLGNKFAHKVFTFKQESSFKQELAALAGLCHPHVVHVICCSEGSRGDGSGEKLGIIMELMHKSLFDLLKEYRSRNCTNATMDAPPFTHTQAVDLMLQIAEGVRYIHKQGLVHRDLKSPNILVQFAYPAQVATTTTTPITPAGIDDAPLIAKIADFGLTKCKNLSTRHSHQTPNTGTSKWMAPEVFSLDDGEDPPSRCQPWRMDVYSFGIICYELLTGQEPYQDQPSKIRPRVKAGERPTLPKDVPTRLAVLIRRCWDGNAYRRPHFSKICMELRYIKGILLRGKQPMQTIYTAVGAIWFERTYLFWRRNLTCVIFTLVKSCRIIRGNQLTTGIAVPHHWFFH